MSPRAGTTRTFTISLPPDLADQVERLAARQSRTTSELFREAFRVYRAEHPTRCSWKSPMQRGERAVITDTDLRT